MGIRGVAVCAMVLLTLTGCSSDVEVATKQDDAEGGPDGISGAKLCELVQQDLVQDQIEADLVAVEAFVYRPGSDSAASCQYRTKEHPVLPDYAITTYLTVGEITGEYDPRAILAGAYGNLRGEREFEPIDGLGDAAGFGPGPQEGDPPELTVIFRRSGSKRAQLLVRTGEQFTGEPTAETLKPIAEQIVDGLAADR